MNNNKKGVKKSNTIEDFYEEALNGLSKDTPKEEVVDILRWTLNRELERNGSSEE